MPQKSQLKQELRYYPVTLFAGEEARKVREEMAVNYRNTVFQKAKLGLYLMPPAGKGQKRREADAIAPMCCGLLTAFQLYKE